MFSRSVVLGSAAIVAFASSLEHLVDDADIKVRGATLEPISQCPATTSRTFHHDGLQKDRRASATFNFDPPRDGCYVIEEKHPQLKKCEASANTKVHVHYCKGLQAAGTVDQTPKTFSEQPQDQWTFIATLLFYKGHPGNVTLSNEGTEPGTLTVFDQVRFSWSANDCFETHAHPRRAEIRMTVDFKHIADRATVFGIALKKKLAEMTGIPENSLRLTGLRSGSIIAEFLVMPSVSPVLDVVGAKHSIELMSSAVAENAAELCALTGGPVEGCNVELRDLGFAKPTVKPFVPESVPESVQESVQESAQEQQETNTQAHETTDNTTILVCTVAVVGLLLFASICLYMVRSRKTKISSTNSKIPSTNSYTVKVQSVEISMEEGQSVEEKEPVDQEEDKSTDCPSISDKQSEPSLSGDVDNTSSSEQGMSVVKIVSKRSRSGSSSS